MNEYNSSLYFWQYAKTEDLMGFQTFLYLISIHEFTENTMLFFISQYII